MNSINNTESAKNIGYNNTDSGLTAMDVQGAIDEVAERVNNNILGTPVVISEYTSANPYVCPSDGYVKISLSGGGSMGDIYVEGAMLMRINAYSGNNYPSASVFVKKGMHVYIDKLAGEAVGKFYSLT